MLVVSGGMAAAFALPASAATLAVAVKAKASAAVAVQAFAAPSAVQAPLVPPAFGNIDFTGVTKPKPVDRPTPKPVDRPTPKPVDRPTTNGVSRSAARVPLTTGTALDPALVSKLFGIAASLNGTPYLWGGTTPAGFDCSGYTAYVFNKIGTSLPRTAEQQRQFATPVSNPQPGDLVFFGVPAYHNGIYAGNGMMWDAPKTGKTVGLHAIWAGTVTYGRVL